MTRTDNILAAIHGELEARRREIDDCDTRSVTVCVKLNQHTGRARAVIFTRETERDLTMLPTGTTV